MQQRAGVKTGPKEGKGEVLQNSGEPGPSGVSNSYKQHGGDSCSSNGKSAGVCSSGGGSVHAVEMMTRVVATATMLMATAVMMATVTMATMATVLATTAM
eukprot:6213717-Pleurochrysis_carterae.AAC.3